MATGARPGSASGAKKVESAKSKAGGKYDGPVYGVTTWQARHVTALSGGRAKITYISGKHGRKTISHTVGGMVAESLLARKADSSSPRETIFGTSKGKLNTFLKDIGVKSSKDFRTAVGTNIAFRLIKSLGEVKHFASEKAMNEAKTKIAEKAALQLGNSSAICLSTYINPSVWKGWTFTPAKVKISKAK